MVINNNNEQTKSNGANDTSDLPRAKDFKLPKNLTKLQKELIEATREAMEAFREEERKYGKKTNL